MLTTKDFLDAGYKKYSAYLQDWAKFLVQKEIKDDHGIRYFITIYVYDPLPDKEQERFEVDLQFHPKGLPTVCVKFLHSDETTIEQIETMAMHYWKVSGADYYEIF